MATNLNYHARDLSNFENSTQKHSAKKTERKQVYRNRNLNRFNGPGVFNKAYQGRPQNENVNRNPKGPPMQINPYTQRAFSPRYHRILKKRKKLPVWNFKDEFMEMLKENKIMIVVGETGSGKTTQIPQWCIEYSNSLGKKGVACTQPRRRAAISLAERVSQEMDVRLGETVGYSIRFENVTSATTKLKFITDGMLLRQIVGNSALSEYGVIFIDEAHERSLNTDVLMALLKQKASEDPNIRIVIMSATLEKAKFINYFNAPVLEIPGFTYPVQNIYSPCLQPSYISGAVRQAVDIHKEETEKGDILIFLTGQEEINTACKTISEELKQHGSSLGKVDCIPLYSTLSQKAQCKIYSPAPKDFKGTIGRKIIVSTNMAETSLTIDGIRFVIDSGFTKQKNYDPKTRLESLQVCDISQASANQRKGRAGRTAPGKCYRLYTEEKYDKMEKNTKPEILRFNMASVVLNLKKLGIHDILNFDFIDAPNRNSISRAIDTLKKLKALDQAEKLTNLGDSMAEFPLDPQMSKMLIASKDFDCTPEILTIAAMLSVQSCYMSRSEIKIHQKNEEDDIENVSSKNRATKRVQEFREARCDLNNSRGDHYTLLNVFNEFIENEQSYDWCIENCIKYNAIFQAKKARDQLSRIMVSLGLIKHNLRDMKSPGDEEDTEIRIGKALATGFFMQVARFNRFHRGRNYYVCNGSLEFQLQQDSSCTNAEYVIYNECIKTKLSLLSIVSEIDPSWLPSKYEDCYAEEPTHTINAYDNQARVYEGDPHEMSRVSQPRLLPDTDDYHTSAVSSHTHSKLFAEAKVSVSRKNTPSIAFRIASSSSTSMQPTQAHPLQRNTTPARNTSLTRPSAPIAPVRRVVTYSGARAEEKKESSCTIL